MVVLFAGGFVVVDGAFVVFCGALLFSFGALADNGNGNGNDNEERATTNTGILHFVQDDAVGEVRRELELLEVTLPDIEPVDIQLTDVELVDVAPVDIQLTDVELVDVAAGRDIELVDVELLRVEAGIALDEDGLADHLFHLLQPLGAWGLELLDDFGMHAQHDVAALEVALHLAHLDVDLVADGDGRLDHAGALRRRCRWWRACARATA